MISIRHLSKTYDGNVTPLVDINAEIEKGDVISVIGPSGTGKTSLARIIAAEMDAEIAKIKAEADMQVAQIGADSAEYQGRKEAAIALQRLASINGWTVVTNENGINTLVKANGEIVSAEELEIGSKKYMQYQFLETWNGEYPNYYVGSDNVSTILGTDFN